MTAIAPPPSTQRVLWRANPGKQEKFVSLVVFEALYGGAKGGGKSDAILYGALRQIDKPFYKALILRESFPEIEELIRRADRVFPQLGGVWSGKQMAYIFPSGALIKFGYCSTVKDVQRYQGQEWAYVGFDELGNVADENVWTDLLKEIRCPDPSVILMARASANPGYAGQAWLKRRFVVPCGKQGERVHWFVQKLPNGMIARKSRAFVPATVWDNPVYANDPEYLGTLYQLPEKRRRQLLDGDWDVGGGLALEELDEDVHLRPAAALFPEGEVPEHWPRFGSLDWGFAHPYSFGLWAVGDEGQLYKLNTITGRGKLPNQIAAAIRDEVDVTRLEYIVAGGDIWQRHVARAGEGIPVPTVAEQLAEAGIFCVRADDGPNSRAANLNNLRDYLKWIAQGPIGDDGNPTNGTPALIFVDTPGNRGCVEQLKGIVTDPKQPEKPLKVNADRDTGQGGDDHYDETAYGAGSRPWSAPKLRRPKTQREIIREQLKRMAQRDPRNNDGNQELRIDGSSEYEPSVVVVGNRDAIASIYG